MRLWDYHTHSNFCDHAIGSLEDYIQSAISQNLNQIGLTAHFPMIYLPESFHHYAMSLEDLPLYFNETNELKLKFKNEIEVLIGLEVDYFKKSFNQIKKVIKKHRGKFDYLIGSIHAIPWDGYEALPIDMKKAVPIIKKLGIDNVFLRYYEMMDELVNTGFFDIIAHFDFLKKNGLKPENNEMDQKILTILDHIKEKDIIVEINTGGLRKSVKEYFPSDDIIKELIQREIPMVLCSDAHTPNDIAYSFNETIVKLKKLGLTKLYRYETQNGSFKKVPKRIP